MAAAERFWVGGVGLEVLWRTDEQVAEGEHALLMVGWPGAGWHLELVADVKVATAAVPTEEDLLVLYLDGSLDDGFEQRLGECGGRRVQARNPYWERWGSTFVDPDGYRLVLSHRSWA